MKKLYLSLLLTFCTIIACYAQNAFYDAQFLANLATAQKNLLKDFLKDSKYRERLSDEDSQCIKQVLRFIDTPFSKEVESVLINTPRVKDLLNRLPLEIARENMTPGMSAFGPEEKQSILSGFSGITKAVSRVGSADFQTMLVDATATYIAESFKEDMTYLYFSRLREKMDKLPELSALLPKTYEAVSKMDIFNYKDLGNSWKVAFENDVENLPFNFRDFVNRSEKDTWAGKIRSNSNFTYYSYAIDIFQPLIKGYHPIEVLQILDENYRQKDDRTTYTGMIHFINLLQTQLQDTTAHAHERSSDNIWISYNQLKELNTEKEQQYFMALLYQQDRSFFEGNGLGKKIAAAIFPELNQEKPEGKYIRFIKALPKLLILFNQIENGVVEIREAKVNKSDRKEQTRLLLSNVISVVDTTNSFLRLVEVDQADLTPVRDFLHFSHTAFNLYDNIVSKNYSGLIDNVIHLLDSLTTNGYFVDTKFPEIILLANQYNQVINIDNCKITAHDLLGVMKEGISLDGLDTSKMRIGLKKLINYPDFNDQVRVLLDNAMTGLLKNASVLNDSLKAMAFRSDNFPQYVKLLSNFNKYGRVISQIANAQNSDELKQVIRSNVMPPGSYAVQRTSFTTLTIATHVGALFSLETNDNWTKSAFNTGLTVPIGFELTRGTRTKDNGNLRYLSGKEMKSMTGWNWSLFLQVFDLGAVVNYRFSGESEESLPHQVLLKQVFSPGLSVNLGIKNAPLAIGGGIQYTPSLRTIGEDLEANAVRLFLRISWTKPLIPIFIRREKSNGIPITAY